MDCDPLITLYLVVSSFPLQRTDPAPFYIFDEIDAALDPVYRHAVADLIREQSKAGKVNRAQFLVSTFKEEMVQHSDKCYGISFARHVRVLALWSVPVLQLCRCRLACYLLIVDGVGVVVDAVESAAVAIDAGCDIPFAVSHCVHSRVCLCNLCCCLAIPFAGVECD